MTSKTGLNVVTATRFSSSDYEKIKFLATAKRLTINEVYQKHRTLLENDKYIYELAYLYAETILFHQ